LAAVDTILNEMLAVLKPQGKVFSLLLASGSYGDGLGTEIEPGTYTDIREGPLHGMGVNHFFTLEEVQQMFARFSDVQIEYSVRSMENQQHLFKLWVVRGTKPT
jgi:hypothetical protein